MKIDIEKEEDGRWIAEVSDLPGVLAYGKTREDAIAKVEALALRVIADRIDHGETIPELDEFTRSLHESMAFRESPHGSCRTPSYWLVH